MKEKNKLQYVMSVIAFCVVGITAYTLLTYGQTYLHSDTEASLRYYNSMISSGQLFPDTWNYNNSELYTSYLVFNISYIMYALVKNVIIARVIASVVVLAITVMSVIWFSKVFLKNESWVISIPLFFVFIRSNNSREMILWETEYINLIIAFTLVFGITYRILFGNKKIGLVIMNCIFLVMLTGSGTRYLAEYILPFFAATVLILLLEKKLFVKENLENNIKNIMLGIIIPALIGYVFYYYICSGHLMDSGTYYNEIEIVRSMEAIVNNIKVTGINLIKIFGYNKDAGILNNFVAIIVAVAVFFIGPVLECLKYKHFSHEKKILILFGIIHNILLVGVIIVATKLIERYLLSSVFIAILFSADYMYSLCFDGTKKVRYIFLPIFMVLTVLLSVNLASISRVNGGWKEVLASQKKVGEILAKKGVTKGYASYWNAYQYEYYSNQKVKFGAVFLSDRVMEKNYCLVDLKAFEPKEKRSCILLTKWENEQFNSAVHILLGPEAETFTINDTYVYDNDKNLYYKTDLVVYVYNEDVGDKLTDGISDGYCPVNEMQFNWVGTMDENTMYLENGGYVHGPYSTISKGHYNVKIEGKNLSGCDCAIVSENAQENINSTVLNVTDEYIEMDLTISKRVNDIQFCLLNTKDETVEFKDVVINKQK